MKSNRRRSDQRPAGNPDPGAQVRAGVPAAVPVDPGPSPAAVARALAMLPDATVVVDGSGTVVAVNDLAVRMFGAAEEELVGQPATDVLLLTDDTRDDWWTSTRPLEGDPRLGLRLVERDLVLRDARGRHRPVTVTARRIPTDGRIGQVVVSLRRGEQRQRVDALRSDLVSTVSHELRAPITSVRGFTKTMLAKWDRFSDEQKRQMLETVNEDADRVTRLLGELLDVSRIDAGRLRLSRRMIDVRDAAANVVGRFAVRHPERTYAVAIPDGLPRTYADPDKLEQVLSNLCENATNYGHGTVEIGASVEDTVLRLWVSDEGGTLDLRQAPHLFTKFFRRSGERHSGTGLGLYISKGIVEAHGGQIWADADAGRRTTFHLTLPLGGLELAGITDETRRVLTDAPRPAPERRVTDRTATGRTATDPHGSDA